LPMPEQTWLAPQTSNKTWLRPLAYILCPLWGITCGIKKADLAFLAPWPQHLKKRNSYSHNNLRNR
jgi:hypothetical protein